MPRYRDRIEIISDVLSVALNSGSEGGASSSTLMRRSNLSYRALEQLLRQLLSAGLLLERRRDEGVRYVVSDKGAEFLEKYRQFAAFADSYGLRL